MASARGEVELVAKVIEFGELTLTEAARLSGISKSWAWKLAVRLREEGIITLERRGGVVILRPGPSSFRRILRIGILRASEYPYIIPLARRLEALSSRVDIVVYDEAYRLASDLAVGRLHLGMAPAVTLLSFNRLTNGLLGIAAGGSRGGVGIVEANTGEGHATTMASTMELCAEKSRLPHPRVYARSGRELLELLGRRTRYSVVWEPYLYQAKRLGYRVEECDLPFCCLLGANHTLIPYVEKIQAMFSDAIAEARKRLGDPVLIEAYSRLIGMDPAIVKATVASYEFLEEPPVEDLLTLSSLIQRVVLPEWSIRRALYK